MIKFYEIVSEVENLRIDVALSKISAHSRSMIQKLIYDNRIILNGEFVKKANLIVKLGEIYEINEFESNVMKFVKEKGELDIIYEDEFLIVINKKAGIVIHPGANNYSNTLMNHLAYHAAELSDLNGEERLGVVHRLDKHVSGCVIFAKNNQTHAALGEQFENRTIKKKYIAICYNKISESEFICENYIGRGRFDRQKMCIYKEGESFGKYSYMECSLKKVWYLGELDGFISLINCFPKTGRMHQIRVQLANKKLPIINDSLYGKKEIAYIQTFFKDRIALHASEITFFHPNLQKEICLKAEDPKEFSELQSFLEK